MTLSASPIERLVRGVRSELLITAWRLGMYMPPDRRILDGVILPAYAQRAGFERMLFVGVKAYNAGNRDLYRGKSYATIDPNPAFAPFGGEPHVVDGLENIAQHFAPASFDVIVVNGVIGHGLNPKPLVERAIAGCRDALRQGGELVLGVNEQTETAVDLGGIGAFARFEPIDFAPLGAARHVVETPLRERTHTFLFYKAV